ncbi:hypothetical protein ACLKA6_016381 [Drosophila palustris]
MAITAATLGQLQRLCNDRDLLSIVHMMRLRLRLEPTGTEVEVEVEASAPLAASNYTLMVNNSNNNSNNNNKTGYNGTTCSARCQHYKEIVITIMAQ